MPNTTCVAVLPNGEQCDRTAYGGNLRCHRHRDEHKKGLPFTPHAREYRKLNMTEDELKDHILENVRFEWNEKPLDTPCWTWTRSKFSTEYAQTNGKDFPSRSVAHLVIKLWNNMECKDGEVIRHRCKQNRACVNPDHLHTGTHVDNMRDKIEDGTSPCGERNSQSKLKEGQVVEIYKRSKAGERQVDTAAEFNISSSAVSAIKCKKYWDKLTDLVDQGLRG